MRASGRAALSEFGTCAARAIAMTTNTSATNESVTSWWNRSDMELTNTRRGLRHRSGASTTSGCIVTPNPGPLVRESPSR